MLVVLVVALVAAPAYASRFEADCNDLLEWNDDGTLQAATRFPAPIKSVSAGPDGTQLVELAWGLTVHYKPGAPAPGRGPIALACGRGAAVHSSLAAWPD